MNVFLRTMASCLVFLFSLWCEPQLSNFLDGHWLVSRLGFCGGTLSPQLGGAVARGSPAGT